MGVVYEARHRELGALVALKFLHPKLVAKPDVAARFLHEARAGTRIKSLHVARVHDVGTHAGAPFIVLEHLKGRDLGAVLEERGPLSLTESADLLLQACEAIHEAHALGIVHRDLKPSNLFVTNGPDGLKVLDFGISKSPFAEQAAKTATHAVIGSPFYMSPEQLSASRNVDARSDVWSLGVILYQMLTDTVPFAGSSIMEIHAAIREGAWSALSAHREGVPAALEELVSHALERDREARLPSVLAFASRLAPFGGEVAHESLARMRRVAAHASGAPPTPALTTVENVDLNGPTVVDARSWANAAPPLRRWMRVVALGTAAGAVLGGGAFLWWPSTTISATSPALADAPSTPSATLVTAAEPAPSSLPSATTVVAPSAPTRSPPSKPACTGSATPECEAACQAQVRGACEALATALVNGKGAPPDPARAARLFTAACDAGSMSACSALGALYGRGEGVAQDDAKAVAFYSRACDGRYVRGCLNLGGMYFDGTGVPRDEVRGAQLFRRTCEAGEPAGCRNLGIAYRTGRGVPTSEQRAREFEARGAGGQASGSGPGQL